MIKYGNFRMKIRTRNKWIECILHHISLSTHKPISLLAFLIFCVLLPGCYGTETVKIKVMIDSRVNMENYKTIAVLDLIDEKKDSITEQGRILARMIRRKLRDSKEFNVISEGTINLTLEEEIDKDRFDDKEFMVSICDTLGADAILVGTFDFYQMAQPISYIAERYYPKTGTYSPEARTYIQRVNHFKLRAKVIDGKNGSVIYDFSPSYVESPEYGNSWLSLFSSGADSTSLRSIAIKPISNLVLNLVPHYEYERRVLVR